KFAQFAPHLLGHAARARRRAVEVARRILMLKIAPALEGAEWPRLHQHQLAVHHEATAPDAILIREWPDREQPLAAQDFAADHPIERATADEFVGALRHHPRGVDVLGLLAILSLLLEALL